MVVMTHKIQNILPIVVAGITDGKRWLFIKRNHGDYKGYWALIGGKLEYQEELKEAILREIKEEAGIDGKLIGIKAIINERLIEHDKLTRQFLIFVFEVKVGRNGKKVIKNSYEGELKWFSKEEVEQMKKQFIPSDYYMLSLIWQNNERIKVSEVIMKQKEKHELEIIKVEEY